MDCPVLIPSSCAAPGSISAQDSPSVSLICSIHGKDAFGQSALSRPTGFRKNRRTALGELRSISFSSCGQKSNFSDGVLKTAGRSERDDDQPPRRSIVFQKSS